jgi:hypothetical protein
MLIEGRDFVHSMIGRIILACLGLIALIIIVDFYVG